MNTEEKGKYRFFMIGCCFLFSVSLGITLYQAYYRWKYAHDGRSTIGTIVQKYEKRGSSNYTYIFNIDLNDTVVSVSVRSPHSYFEKARVELIYLPDDPDSFIMKNEQVWGLGFISLVAWTALFALFLAGAFLFPDIIAQHIGE